MKTIAVTIDENTLEALDRLVALSPLVRNRSACIRRAVQEFVEQQRRRETEAREHDILHGHRRRLEKQTRALIAEQART